MTHRSFSANSRIWKDLGDQERLIIRFQLTKTANRGPLPVWLCRFDLSSVTVPELALHDVSLHSRAGRRSRLPMRVGHDGVAFAEVAAQQGPAPAGPVTSRWMARFSGRAVDRVVAGVGQQMRCASVSCRSIFALAQQVAQPAVLDLHDLAQMLARPGGWKITTSSMRFGNSGRNVERSTSITYWRVSSLASPATCDLRLAPPLLVMITTVFLKSTVRPWPSVSRPSSSTCKAC